MHYSVAMLALQVPEHRLAGGQVHRQTAHLDELLLHITDCPALVIAVCPELPLHHVCLGQGIYPVHDHNDLFLTCARLLDKIL